MDKLEIKQGSFIQQTQYFIPVEIDLSVFTGIGQTLMLRSEMLFIYVIYIYIF